MPQTSITDGDVRSPLAPNAQAIADYCGVPLGTVYHWSSRGGGPPLIKVGRHLKARWAEIDRWLDTRTKGAS